MAEYLLMVPDNLIHGPNGSASVDLTALAAQSYHAIRWDTEKKVGEIEALTENRVIKSIKPFNEYLRRYEEKIASMNLPPTGLDLYYALESIRQMLLRESDHTQLPDYRTPEDRAAWAEWRHKVRHYLDDIEEAADLTVDSIPDLDYPLTLKWWPPKPFPADGEQDALV
jgi:hypothetical protein